MEVIFLGTGTSHGIPVIGCDCPVCTSSDPKNNRTRCSVYVRTDGADIIIDMSPEFRIQMLREKLSTADAVLITHTHADHLHGLDDIRPMTFKRPIPVYGSTRVIGIIRRRFDYIFNVTQMGGGKPHIQLNPVEGSFFIPTRDGGKLEVVPIPMLHGKLETFGYRIGDFAYLTDCSYIPKASLHLLNGLKVAVIDALRYKEHPTHLSVEKALALAQKLGAGRTYFTHMCHDIDHAKLLSELPEGIEPAYDGLRITI